MKEVNWENYTNESIDFIFEQSNTLLKESFKSFREIINKSCDIIKEEAKRLAKEVKKA